MTNFPNAEASAIIRQASGEIVISQDSPRHLQSLNCSGGSSTPILRKTVGDWSAHRQHLRFTLISNLKKLAKFPKGESRLTFQQEINEQWKCLSDWEKVQVLEMAGLSVLSGEITAPPSLEQLADLQEIKTLATLSSSQRRQALEKMPLEKRERLDACRLRGPAISWLHSTLAAMNSNRTLQGFLHYLSADAQEGLNGVLLNKPDRNMFDVDFDYQHFLKSNANPITLPPEAQGKEVAIIGSGVAGAIAARLLLQAGAKPVIFEQGSKGGRVESRRYHQAADNEAREFSKMGGMRFPSGGRTWFHFLKQFGIRTTPDFPTPGKVPTALQFKNEIIDWPVGADMPDGPMFQKIGADFKQFVSRLMEPMEEARKVHDTEKMQEIFQGYLNKYGNKTLYEALKEGLEEAGTAWTKDEVDAFGALGIGTGGFGMFYSVSFMEILRVMLNRIDTDRYVLPDGITIALDRLYSTEVPLPGGGAASLTSGAEINLRTQVTGIVANDGKPTVELRGLDGKARTKEFASVVVTSTPAAMQEMGLWRYQPGSGQVLSAEAANAIAELRLANSSKLFIRTPTKFWLDDDGNPRNERKADGSFGPIPQNIQTDQAAHSIYCLNYPDTDHGMVLVNYTCGEESDNLMHMTAQERLTEFIKTFEQISPEFAANLTSVNNEMHVIDWQSQSGHHGVSRLNRPGREASQQAAFYQFQESPCGVVLAGDSMSHMGGWVESALQTGIHAACAAAVHLGGCVTEGSPLKLDRNKFNDGKRTTAADAAEC